MNILGITADWELAIYEYAPSVADVQWAAELERRGGDPIRPGHRFPYKHEDMIHAAARNGSLEQINGLLQLTADVDVNSADYRHETAIVKAARNGHIEVVQRLLEAGATIDGVAIRAAIAHGQTEVVKTLLAAGGKVEYWSMHDVFFATENSAVADNPELLDLVLANGAEVDEEDGHDSTTLYEMVKRENLTAVALLLARGADPHHWVKVGRGKETPLSIAAKSGNRELLRLLTDHLPAT